MNFPRSQHTATVLQHGTVLVAGGLGGGGKATDTAEVFNPATNTWTVTSPLIFGRSSHTASLLQDGTVLMAGGDNQGPAQSSLEITAPPPALSPSPPDRFLHPASCAPLPCFRAAR